MSFNRRNVKNMSFDYSKNGVFQREGRSEEKKNQGKGVQCHEGEDFGHVKANCPTYLKRHKKGMLASWSDDASRGEHDDETTNHVMAFIGRCEFDEESCDDDVLYEELDDSYKKLYVKCEEICHV